MPTTYSSECPPKPEYQPYATDITLLGHQLSQYMEALSKAVNRGTEPCRHQRRIQERLAHPNARPHHRPTQPSPHGTGILGHQCGDGGHAGKDRDQKSPMTCNPPSNLQVLSRGIRREAILTFKKKKKSDGTYPRTQ